MIVKPEDVMQGQPPTPESQVSFANYLQHPFSTYGFRSMESVTRTAMIARGGALPDLKLNEKAPSFGQRVVKDIHEVEMPLEQLLSTYNADGFLVMKDGEVQYEQYFNGLSEHQRHIWFSMTKSLVSAAFGILVKKLDLDLSLSPAHYIPELKGSGFARTTLQQVLNHSSAITFKENYVDIESEFLQYYAPTLNMAFLPGAQDVQAGDVEIFGVYDFLSKFIKAESEQEPGVTFEYNSANADLVGWLVARLSGQSLQDFLSENIWQKLGTNHDAGIVVDRAFMGVATGGMLSTLRDAALFGEMIRNDGVANGEQIIPADWVNATIDLDAADQQRFDNNELYNAEAWKYYKNMWWVLDAEAGEYAAVGIHGQVIYINKSKRTVIAQFSSQATAVQVGSEAFRSKLYAMRQLANT